MNELALFAGAGGGILGGKLLGWRTICAVEWAAFPRETLLRRQQDGALPKFPIWDDVQTFDGRPWAGLVDVVSGGFPCQDISAAGKGAGIDGERSGMWKHMARIIDEVRPRFAFVENSPLLTGRGLGRVLGDLAEMGFNAEWGVLGAIDAGAPHRRDRIWIVAHHPSPGRGTGWTGRPNPGGAREREYALPSVAYSGCGRRRESCPWEMEQPGRTTTISGGALAGESAENEGLRETDEAAEYADSKRRQELDAPTSESRRALAGGRCPSELPDPTGWRNRGSVTRPDQRALSGSDGPASSGGWWCAEPRVGRVAHGVAHRVDRLRAIGNGQVPAVAAMAFRELSERLNLTPVNS